MVDHVVEQRVSNLAQGLLTLGTMSGPLLFVLHLIPQGVLAGLFFIMGVQALEGNGITVKILYLCKDRSLTPASDPLSRIKRKQAIYYVVGLELLGFGATFAITQTIAAIGFPIFILLLIPARTFLLPRYFTPDELSLLDGPTASPFTMESVGGNFGQDATSLPTSADPGSGEGMATSPSRLGRRGSREQAVDSIGILQRNEFHRRASFRGRGDIDPDGQGIEMQRPKTESVDQVEDT